MSDKPSMNEQDRNKRRAIIAIEVMIFGYLFVMFLIQMHMYAQRSW